MVEDFKFIVQYGDEEPILCSTSIIEENVIRMDMGLKPKKNEERSYGQQ